MSKASPNQLKTKPRVFGKEPRPPERLASAVKLKPAGWQKPAARSKGLGHDLSVFEPARGSDSGLRCHVLNHSPASSWGLGVVWSLSRKMGMPQKCNFPVIAACSLASRLLFAHVCFSSVFSLFATSMLPEVTGARPPCATNE